MLFERFLEVFKNFNSILDTLDSFQQGSILLHSGNHVLDIKTRKEPVEVWVSLKDNSGTSVCNGDIDKISYTLNQEGFILYVDVKSDFLKVDWLSIFETKK